MGVAYKSKYGFDHANSDSPYSKDELRAMLPKIGDRRIERAACSDVIQLTSAKPGMCTVVGVHAEHFWYRVRFDSTGTCQCFKLPRLGTDGMRMK